MPPTFRPFRPFHVRSLVSVSLNPLHPSWKFHRKWILRTLVIVIFGICVAPLPAYSQEVVFKAAVVYASGSYFADSVAVADVNGDGKPDIVVTNGNGVGVLLGNGDGTFQPVVIYASGLNFADSVAVADVNGDGKRDIVVAGGTPTGMVGVLLGNGDGTFQTAVTYNSGGYSTISVAVADVSGDGKPDIVVASTCASSSNCAPNGTVGVLLGNGDGTFQTAVTYASGGYYTTSMAVADVSGDGKPDIVVANSCASSSNCANGTVGVLLGNGDGTFQAVVISDSGGHEANSVSSVAVADVNGDGKPDIAVTSGEDTVGVLLGNGDGTFQTAVTYASGGYYTTSVAVADVNGDGKPDLVVANGYNTAPGSVDVLLGNGDGTFQKAGSYNSRGNGAYSVAVADVNGDGKPDIVVANLCDSQTHCASSSVGVLIQIAPTKTLLSSSLNPSLIGQSVTFTATVNPAFGGTPTGTVEFKSQPGGVLLGTETLNGNTASFTTQFSTAKSYSIYAVYSGDANCLSSTSASVAQKVNKFPTSTLMTSNLNPSNFGQSVTFTATVTSSYGTPTGTITFRRGTTALGTIDLTGNTASFSTSALSAGTNSINTVYSGDTNFAASTLPNLSQKVNKIASTTTLASSMNPSTLGQSVTFTATVTAASGTPTGTVTFKKGSTTLGTATLSGGMATFATSTLPSGSNSIKASYGESTDYLTSSSAVLTQMVH